MPVVRTALINGQVRPVRCYTRPNGKRRFIKLYGAYCNMLARIRGQVRTGRGGLPIWAGLPTDFRDFDDFRTWALANGYSRTRCSLDREHSHIGYLKSNCRWVTCAENSMYANLIGAKKRKQLAAQRRVTRAVPEGCRL
jgi:hypothetical protein